jgi:hypothetical protein
MCRVCNKMTFDSALFNQSFILISRLGLDYQLPIARSKFILDRYFKLPCSSAI